MNKLLRRGSNRKFILAFLGIVLVSLLVCLNYTSQTQTPNSSPEVNMVDVSSNLYEAAKNKDCRSEGEILKMKLTDYKSNIPDTACPIIQPRNVDIDTREEFQKFDFQPSWISSKEYWDDSFEKKYAELKKDPSRPPLKVILVPHSHTDPGWLKTFEQYFHDTTKGILNNMIAKLEQWPNMTFIWSEISFLSLWWESANPNDRATIKRLVKEGRLEITTGGWVMSDEATSHIYAMLDQLIEGHQWVKSNLDAVPESGWSVDPFGHGATIPYLLKASGVTGTVIQRIHFAWKQWLAKKQYGDFIWQQAWDQNGVADILTHNQPFDVYNFKHSCGPHTQICLNFDFRKIQGEHTEYSIKAVNITPTNVKEKAELLLEQYSKIGSLLPHNVVLIPLGDDFRYDYPIEWDQQYNNYKFLVDYINSRQSEYNAQVVFGTPKDYFHEVKERMEHFPSLKGDFFVYSDIFSEARPAYWSGYFTTRPYLKILDRELESNLRSAEILYTIALNIAKQQHQSRGAEWKGGRDIKLYETWFEKLTKARRNLGLFQHHDAITGTSKSFVMENYALKLFESITDMTRLQSFSIQSLAIAPAAGADANMESNPVYVLSESVRDSYENLPKKIPIDMSVGDVGGSVSGEDEKNQNMKSRKVILFNSLVHYRQEVISLEVTSYKIRVLDPNNKTVLFQIAPVMDATSIIHGTYKLLFVANLKPLSIATYNIQEIDKVPTEAISTVYCNSCGKDAVFPIKQMQLGDIQLENKKIKLLFDKQTGFLQQVTKLSTNTTMQCDIQFAAYQSAPFHSGAYLFKPDSYSRDTDKNILESYMPHRNTYMISGVVSSGLTVEYERLLTHHVSIYHDDCGGSGSHLLEAIHLRNIVDFETSPKNGDKEMFMRLKTDILNGDVPEFYADLNGHQMIKRTKVERIGIEGNYYPITTMAYIQDKARRVTLLVNHAQGAASYQQGWLEVMLDRRTLLDDTRGMGEGLLDSRKTVFEQWLLLENINGDRGEEADKLYSRPSLIANLMSNNLNYPVNIFLIEKARKAAAGDDTMGKSEIKLAPETNLLSQSFPCDVHLLNLRTIHDTEASHFPVDSALLVLHRQGYSCTVGTDVTPKHCPVFGSGPSGGVFPQETFFTKSIGELNITRTSLTGTQVEKYLKNGLQEISINPMEIQTYKVHFVH